VTGAAAEATVLYVAYRTRSLSFEWLPKAAPVVVVHNDRTLGPPAAGRPIVHVFSESNVGFGAAVNRGLERVQTQRVVLVNPDAELKPFHWDALVYAEPSELVTVPLLDSAGVPTQLVARYPSPVSILSMGLRLGRFLPRGTRARRLVSPLLGAVGRWPLAEHWVSAAVLSADVERLRSVGGFDPSYFLYFEDVDLCRRLAQQFPAMTVRVADVKPGIHAVGASGAHQSNRVERHRTASARRWATRQRGVLWRAAEAAIAVRERLLRAS
jgi:N-acetylglucosaminyl-diphospho-decaprenol L-rhamnosyltransferase